MTIPLPQIAKLIEGRFEIPTPPAMLMQVMREMRDPDTSAAKLATMISRDAGFTANILRIANSSLYGLSREVKTIQQAIIILGHKSLQELVVSASNRAIYKKFGPVEKNLWEHSLGAAVCAHMLAKKFRLKSREEAFVCGLMHDVGKVIMNNESAEAFAHTLEEIKESGSPSIEAEQAEFGFTHADVGSLLIRKWQLPESLEKVTFYHHNYDMALTMAPDFLEQIALTGFANRLCHYLGLGVARSEESGDFSDDPAVTELGLDTDEIKEMLPEIEQAFHDEKDLLS